jgi:aminoglycoside 3-N-acetyltransferase I
VCVLDGTWRITRARQGEASGADESGVFSALLVYRKGTWKISALREQSSAEKLESFAGLRRNDNVTIRVVGLPPIAGCSTSLKLHQLTAADVPLLRALNALFGEAFGDGAAYGADPPSDGYLEALLAKEHVIVLVALLGQEVAGGLVAYELDKFERARRELYIYDLAVAEVHRRQGIATTLIKRLREIAGRRGAWVVYVQADYGDKPAIALYEKHGTREDVLHFDIDVVGKPPKDGGEDPNAP